MPITKLLATFPDIYNEFQCKGGSCRSTCCQEWRIDISRAEYNRVRHCVSPKQAQTLFKRLPRNEASDKIYANMQMNENNQCPLLSDDGMCSLQREHGYKILPQVCKQFPRLFTIVNTSPLEYTIALDTGCERVLELLWKYAESGLHFTTADIPISDKVIHSVMAKHALSDFANDIIYLCIWILQNRSYSLSDRMILLGFAMQELQEIQTASNPNLVPSWFAKWHPYTKGDALKKTLSELPENPNWFLLNNLSILVNLSMNHPEVQELLSIFEENFDFVLKNNAISLDSSKYAALCAEFYKKFPNMDNFLENYLVLTLFRENFPFSQDSVWKSYLYMASFYSILRFLPIACASDTAENIIDLLTLFSRMSLNAQSFSSSIIKSLEQNDSNSLAPIAILVRG